MYGSASERVPERVHRTLLELSLLLLLACGPTESSAPMASNAPARAPQEADSAESPWGIVALSPLATRFVTQLGAGHRLLGVDVESSRLPEVELLPVVDLAGALRLAPRIMLVAALPPEDDPIMGELRSSGVRLVEFAPHDLVDVFDLCRGLGVELVGPSAATAFERRIARPLALIGGRSPPRGRPRVAAVIGFDPPELAGGHSFETDLIEIAGGSSVTHGGEENRISLAEADWDALAPDLILVTASKEPTPAERRSALATIPERYAVEFFRFDRETFWLREPAADAERLHALIASRVDPP